MQSPSGARQCAWFHWHQIHRNLISTLMARFVAMHQIFCKFFFFSSDGAKWPDLMDHPPVLRPYDHKIAGLFWVVQLAGVPPRPLTFWGLPPGNQQIVSFFVLHWSSSSIISGWWGDWSLILCCRISKLWIIQVHLYHFISQVQNFRIVFQLW